jgi:hypothetical protein
MGNIGGLICALLLTAACGGDVEGDPLLGGDATGDFRGSTFTPEFGFARIAPDNDSGIVMQLFLADAPINCGDDFMGLPREGTYLVLNLEGDTVGSYASVFYNFTRVDGAGNLDGGGSNAGTLEITAADAEHVAGTLAYDQMIEENHYAMNGTVDVLHCP